MKNEFTRTELLIGKTGVEKLKNSKVADTLLLEQEIK